MRKKTFSEEEKASLAPFDEGGDTKMKTFISRATHLTRKEAAKGSGDFFVFEAAFA